MIDQDSVPESSPKLLYAKAWADNYVLIDGQLCPLGMKAMGVLPLSSGGVVVDIGCGAGQTLLQLAERVGPEGQVIGVDVAELLVEIAKRRTYHLGNVKLIEVDAQFLDLPTGSADAVYSRFGVMSFSDVDAAFANFRRILKPSGAIAFVCWRSLQENELDHLPLSMSGVSDPIDETPFSLSDAEHIHRTLAAAGFRNITIKPHDENVSSGDVDAMTSVLLSVGPLGKIIRENPRLRAKAEGHLRDGLAALGDPSRVKLRASVWIVAAVAAAMP
jgi:SAM-dependent methyltransferase